MYIDEGTNKHIKIKSTLIFEMYLTDHLKLKYNLASVIFKLTIFF